MPDRPTNSPSPRTVRVVLAAAVVVLSALTVAVLVRPDGQEAQGRPVAASALARRVAEPVRPRQIEPPSTAVPPPAVHASSTAVATRPATHACLGNSEPKEVLVSLADQHVWLCTKHVVAADFAVTTGRRGDATPTGTYDVQALTRNTTLNPDSGGAFHVRYWIPFKWGMFGFHDAPWQTIPFGSPQYRTAGSQGCVHMRTADIARLFRWVSLGTTVRVIAGTPA